jgi:hypothetical protein
MKPNNRKFSNNLSKYRSEIISFSGINIKNGKKSAKKDPLSKLSRKEKRKLERKFKHAKNLAFHAQSEMPKLESLIERKKRSPNLQKDDDKKVVKPEKKEKPKISKEDVEKVRKIKIKPSKLN